MGASLNLLSWIALGALQNSRWFIAIIRITVVNCGAPLNEPATGGGHALCCLVKPSSASWTNGKLSSLMFAMVAALDYFAS